MIDCDRCKHARIIKKIWRCGYFSTLTGQGKPCSRVKYEECRPAFRRVTGSTPAENSTCTQCRWALYCISNKDPGDIIIRCTSKDGKGRSVEQVKAVGKCHFSSNSVSLSGKEGNRE